MRRYILYIVAILLATSISAQHHIRVWQNGVSDRVSIENVGSITFSSGELTIKGTSYRVSDIDSIIIVPEITVAYNGSTATVSIPESVEKDVTAVINGADVSLTNTNTSNEIEVILSGTSDDGSLTYTADYKTTIIMDALNLSSRKGAPLNIQCGKRIALELCDGTTNSLTDAAGGVQKGCLYCKGHLEIEGNGTLNVTGNTRHGIATKEYLQLKKSTGIINIIRAQSDAIHCGQYFQMNGGTVNIDANTLGDGIQAEYVMLDDDITPDATKENNGKMFIKGGIIRATITSQDCKAIKADSDISISGGDITITAQGNGSRGIQSDGSMVIGTEDNPTTINITAAGGKCTLPECAADPHKSMGIKLDGNLTINAGNITVANTGRKSKGIKIGGTYRKHRTNATVSASVEAAQTVIFD